VAGAGFQTFGVGDVLTASDVNTYLMQQAVMNFADSGARGSAIGTATEGMVSYLQDTDAVEVYDGSAWTAVAPDVAGIGTNVVQAVKTDVFSTNATSPTDVTGLSATITPTSASSKVLVIAQVNYNTSSSTYGYFVRINGGNLAYVGDAAGSRSQVAAGAGDGLDRAIHATTIVTLDSPATTSSTTYQVQAWVGNASGTWRLNRTSNDSDSAVYPRSASSITVIEVAA